MVSRSRLLLAGLTVCLAIPLSSCADAYVKGRGHGPPPHAPAHGYRHKHRHGIELVYDSGLDVYVVVGYPAHFYHDGHYYRLRKGNWQGSAHINGPWKPAPHHTLPPGLRKGKSKTKGKGRQR